MTGMVFEYALVIGTLVVLEGLLAVDNAVVLAVLVSELRGDARRKALLYGLVGAFAFRAVGLLAASWLVQTWWLKLVGAAYLIYLTVHHFWIAEGHTSDGIARKTSASFWRTVVLVELTDVAFSVDSIVAAVALSPKLWVIYTGGMLGIIAMRFAAGAFVKLLDRFPGLKTAAYVLPTWIGMRLALAVAHERFGLPTEMPAWVFWPVMMAILGGGILFGRASDKGLIAEVAELREAEAGLEAMEADADAELQKVDDPAPTMPSSGSHS